MAIVNQRKINFRLSAFSSLQEKALLIFIQVTKVYGIKIDNIANSLNTIKYKVMFVSNIPNI